jgi:outer membrane lipoprotein carrier protein
MRVLIMSVGLVGVASAVAVLASSRSVAQPQMDANQVAARVQAFYDQTRTVQAEFHQTYYHKLYDRYDRSRGNVVFKKPGKMRWTYARPNGKEIVSDGSRMRVYEPPDEGERSGQGFEQSIDQNQLPAAFSFLTGTGRLQDQFTFRLLDARRHAFPDGHVLELRPRQPTPHFTRVLFFVRMVGDPPAGVVHRVLIVDEIGNRNRFDFSELRFNRDVPDGRFNYTFPRGTRIVEP